MPTLITIQDINLDQQNLAERGQLKATLNSLGHEMLQFKQQELFEAQLQEELDDPDSDVEVWNVSFYHFLCSPKLPKESKEEIEAKLQAAGRRLSWLV